MQIVITRPTGRPMTLNEKDGAVLIVQEGSKTVLYAPSFSYAMVGPASVYIDKPVCRVHGKNCPGDSGHMFMDMNHPDDMFGVQTDVL